jgi:hypothetical protein
VDDDLPPLVRTHLGDLERASPSTQRQRAWALRDLVAFTTTHGRLRAPLGAPGSLLDPALVRDWLHAAATAEPPASLPGLRARASAVRALARTGELTGACSPATGAALAPVLRLPAPGPATHAAPDPVRRLLSLADPDAGPRGVLPPVWARFCAHAHLLALTGEREDVMATLPVHAADGLTLSVTAGLHPRSWTMPALARTALTAWLTHRAALVAPLRGSEPTALWVRARPSADHRTGAVRPAGLPLSDRGLRLAFTSTVALLALGDSAVHDVSTADLRSYGRREE